MEEVAAKLAKAEETEEARLEEVERRWNRAEACVHRRVARRAEAKERRDEAEGGSPGADSARGRGPGQVRLVHIATPNGSQHVHDTVYVPALRFARRWRGLSNLQRAWLLEITRGDQDLLRLSPELSCSRHTPLTGVVIEAQSTVGAPQQQIWRSPRSLGRRHPLHETARFIANPAHQPTCKG